MTAEPTQLPDLPWLDRGDDCGRPGTLRAADRGFGWQRHGSGMPHDTSGMPVAGDDAETDGAQDVRTGAGDSGTDRRGDRHAARAARRAARADRHAGAVPPVPQRHAETPEPTHHIVVPDRADPAPDDRHASRAAAVPVRRLGGTVRGWVSELRFVSESPGSLRDHLRFAQKGRYGGSDNQFIRSANIVFYRAISAPLLSVVYLFAWAFLMRLNRAATLLGVLLFLAPVLNGIPVLHWLIPDLLDVTSWFAGEVPAP